MKSIVIPKDIEIYVFKSKWFKTVILEYKEKESKIWFNINKDIELKINKESRVLISKGLTIRLIERGIKTLKLGYIKEYILEDIRPQIKGRELILGKGKKNFIIP